MGGKINGFFHQLSEEAFASAPRVCCYRMDGRDSRFVVRDDHRDLNHAHMGDYTTILNRHERRGDILPTGTRARVRRRGVSCRDDLA